MVDVVETHADVLVERIALGDLVADQHQFVEFGQRSRHGAAVGDAVPPVAVRRETHGAPVDGLADQARHLAFFLVGGVFLDAPFAHHEVAQRAVADHPGDIDAGAETFHGVQVVAVVNPVPGQAGEDGLTGNVLHRLHHAGEQFAVLRPARRERHPAVADQGRGDAVAGHRRDVRIPADLRIEVRVHVDEAGRDRQALGVEFASTLAVDGADCRDRARIDGKVARNGLAAQTVHELAAPDNEFVRHSSLLLDLTIVSRLRGYGVDNPSRTM